MSWRELLDDAKAARVDQRFHDALQLADRAALHSEEARYHAALFRGDILLNVGDAAAALSTYESVADPLTPDPTLDCARGIALFDLVMLPEAENALRSAARGAPDLAEAHFTLGLIAELLGSGEDEELFRRARQLDSERYPATPLMSHDAFEELVEETLATLPKQIRRALADIPVLVTDMPHPDDLRRSSPPVPPTAVGMFVGSVPGDTKAGEPYEAPAILLFKRNLERAFPERVGLAEQLRKTVLHEVSRVLGLSPLELVAAKPVIRPAR